MVKCCCVAGCNNKWGVTVGGKKVRFFKIPRCTGKQSNLRKHNEWVTAIDRGDWRPNAEDVVCGEHFLTGTNLTEYTNGSFTLSKIRHENNSMKS